jgi:leucyl/phenylalanyl-tRNA--protein transferase
MMLTRSQLADFGGFFSERIEPEPIGPALRRRFRDGAFAEGFAVWLRRMTLVGLRVLHPTRIRDLPWIADLWLRDRRFDRLPDPRGSSRDGHIGLAADLAPATMIEAYCRGLSPSALFGPIAWTSRPVRSVASPRDVTSAASRRKDDPPRGWSVDFDSNFEALIVPCARARAAGVIMPPRLMLAFADLYDAGFAHCFAVRDGKGDIVGGGFGVAFGRVFVLEGAFETQAGAALFGLSRFAGLLNEWSFALIERAPQTAWIRTDAFAPMQRDAYLAALTRHQGGDRVGKWRPAPPRRILREEPALKAA